MSITLAASFGGSALAEWQYHQKTDELRGTTRAFASVTSDNTVALSWPTGDVVPELVLRLDDPQTVKAYIYVEKAQLICGPYDVITVRFDSGPVEEYGCHNADAGMMDTAFIQEPMRFLGRLKASSSVLVEANFYRDGAQQFAFPVGNLAWTLNPGN
ncbi:hypothetical protein WDZ92_26485 [Nostoc sp. NIES-2111]